MIRFLCLFLLLVIFVECRNIKPKEKEIENSGSINFTPCLDKDCKDKINTNGNTKHQKHRHRSHKSHKKRPHGKKKTKQLPLSEGLQLQGEDHSAAYGWNMDSQVPRGVSRLEHRLHPNIRHAAKQFMDNLQSVLKKIQNKIRNVDNEYITVGSRSRDAMMEVRKELEELTKENNDVYDSLLDVSQLVRYVYRRAHENGQAGANAISFRSFPQITFVNLNKELRHYQMTDWNASKVYNSVMDLQRRGVQQDATKTNVMSKIKDKTLSEKFRYFEMYDLQQKVRLILQKVDTLSGNVFIPLRRRLMKYKTIKNTISDRVKHARYLTGLAHGATKTARDTFQLNKRYQERRKNDGQHNPATGHHVSRRQRRSTENAYLEVLVQRAIRKSKHLEEVSNVINSKLVPLLPKASAFIKNMESGNAGTLSQTRNIIDKLSATLAKLDDSMDDVRVFLNDTKILEARCQELNGESEVIRCETYGVFEGSGSGEVDDEDGIFTMKSTIPATKTTQMITKTKTTSMTTPSTTTAKSTSTKPTATSLTSTSTTPSTTSRSTSTTPTTILSTTTPITTSSTKTTTTSIPSSSAKTTPLQNTPSLSTSTPSTSLPTISPTSASTSTTASTTTTTTSKTTTTLATTTPSTSTTIITPAPTKRTTTAVPKEPTTAAYKAPVKIVELTLAPVIQTTESTIEGSGTTQDGDSDDTDNDFVFDRSDTDKYRSSTTTKTTSTTKTSTTTLTPMTEKHIEGSGTTSESDRTDDDFVFEEPTTTTQRTTTTISTKNTIQLPVTDDETTEEGSGESETEIKVEEDKKKESEEEEGGNWLWWGDDPNVLYDPHRDFKEKLATQAFNARTKSEKIFNHWVNVSTGFKDVHNRWGDLTKQLNHLGAYVTAAEGLRVSWNTIEPYIADKMTTLPTKSLDIIHKSETTVNISQHTLIVIDEKLKQMLQLKQKRLSKTSNDDQGPAFIADLISNVQTVDQNSKAIARLQQINPAPCKGVQNTATRLRSSIAQLRSKIDKAKTITSSMPLSVSMNGKEVLDASFAYKSVPVSPSSIIDMCINPRSDNMQIATFYGNSTQSYSVFLEDLKPALTITDIDNTKLETISFTSPLKKDQWYSISIRRNGRTVELRLKSLNDTSEEIVEDSYIPVLSILQSTITRAVVGKTSIPSESPYFAGCVSDIVVNGQHLAMSKKKGTMKHCTKTECDSKHLKSMIFEGDGFAKFSLYLIDASYIDNIHLGFQSTQKGGVLLFINDKLKTLQVLISLSEGALHIEVSTRRGTTVLRSSKDTYHDGADHTLNVVFGNDVIEATTDHQDDTFEQELVRQEITSRIADGIYLGGLGVQSHSLSGKAKLRSFSGCISSFSISKKEIPLYMIEESKNVYYGKCSENIWRKCVKFTEQSKPIVYMQSKDANKVYLIVGKDSLGTLLHIKRVEGEDFDVTLFVESKGVEISDNKENKEYKLNSDDNIKDWHVISVEDTGDERLLVSLGTSSIEVPYDVPYRWFSSKELLYDVAVGGLLESDTSTLQGGISSLIINDRPIDLHANIESHQLQHCVRSTMVLHEMDKEDKPVC
ncbi:serine-rich adhesin for platelets-like [Mytilus trossulus]|uniref:serine-rich adhesin for platelets-like n=1 Tax=Mytilus trossulus TaxID=6551 RepID=UPI003003D151